VTAQTVTDTAGAVSNSESNRVYSKIAWRIMPFLMVCYVIAYLDRVNVGFAKLQMSIDLGFSETVFGLGAGLFFIGYFFFEVPSNLLMNRVGARIWIARIMITWGILSGCFFFVSTPTQFYVLRFLLGAAEAGFYPGVILYLTYWFPGHRRAKMIAVFMAAIPLSGIFGGPLSGYLMQNFNGYMGHGGWQWMFVIEALPALVLGIVTLLYLDNDVRSAKWLTDEEKAVVARDIEAETKSKSKTSPGTTKAVFTDLRVWWMCLIYFCFVMGQYGLTFWMPSLVKSTGVQGAFNIGLISAIPFVVAAISMILIGRNADRMRERRWHLIIPATFGAIGFAVSAAYADNTVLAMIALSVAAGGALTCSPLFWSLPTAFLSGTGAVAGIAVINSVGNLAGFVSPYAIGLLNDATKSSAAGMYMLTGMLLLGAVAVFLTNKNEVNR